MDDVTQLLTPGLATADATRILPAVPEEQAAPAAANRTRSPWTWPLITLLALLPVVATAESATRWCGAP